MFCQLYKTGVRRGRGTQSLKSKKHTVPFQDPQGSSTSQKVKQKCEQRHAMWAKQATEQAKGQQLSVSGDLGHVSCSSQCDTLDNQGEWREVSDESPARVCWLWCAWSACGKCAANPGRDSPHSQGGSKASKHHNIENTEKLKVQILDFN